MGAAVHVHTRMTCFFGLCHHFALLFLTFECFVFFSGCLFVLIAMC